MTCPRRALIVIDVQNEYFTGGLPIEHPPVSESLPNLLRAMDAAQARGIPVIVVQHSAPAGAPVFVPGTATWELHPDVAGRPRDHYIEKSLASAFTGTYQPQNKMLDLFGSVALYASRGDEFHTDSARVNLDNSSAEGSEHVTGQGPFGHVEAAGFRIVDRGATVIFTGHTDLYLEPHNKQAAQ